MPAKSFLVVGLLVAAGSIVRGAEGDIADLQHGSDLAKTHCQICHLLPDPSLQDKQTWEKHTLPWMSTKLGIKKVDFGKIPGGRLVQEANILAKVPMLTSNDWTAICRYYIATAPSTPLPQGKRPKIEMDLEEQFTVIRAPFHLANPMTTLVKIVPGSGVFFVGDSVRRALYMLDHDGRQISSLPLGNPPVALQIRPEGLYLTLIGYVAPSDDPIGRCLFIPNGEQGFQRPEILVDQLPRPVDTQIADLNADGREDLVVSHYGNFIGRFSWYEKLANGKYREHILRNQPGALCSYVCDFNKDGRPDIIVLMAQAQEGVFLYTNQGHGEFKETVLLRYPPAWGSSYLEVADFNGDGYPDLLVVNGDNAEYPSSMKNYHGVRIYLNDGNNNFKEGWFFPLNGAYKAVARDFRGAGKLDIACISFFPDYLKSPEESFVYLRNEGNLQFSAHSFPQCTSGRWIAMDAADFSVSGRQDIIIGAFNNGPESIPIPESIRKGWQHRGPNVLILRNKKKGSER